MNDGHHLPNLELLLDLEGARTTATLNASSPGAGSTTLGCLGEGEAARAAGVLPGRPEGQEQGGLLPSGPTRPSTTTGSAADTPLEELMHTLLSGFAVTAAALLGVAAILALLLLIKVEARCLARLKVQAIDPDEQPPRFFADVDRRYHA